MFLNLFAIDVLFEYPIQDLITECSKKGQHYTLLLKSSITLVTYTNQITSAINPTNYNHLNNNKTLKSTPNSSASNE